MGLEGWKVLMRDNKFVYSQIPFCRGTEGCPPNLRHTMKNLPQLSLMRHLKLYYTAMGCRYEILEAVLAMSKLVPGYLPALQTLDIYCVVTPPDKSDHHPDDEASVCCEAESCYRGLTEGNLSGSRQLKQATLAGAAANLPIVAVKILASMVACEGLVGVVSRFRSMFLSIE